MVTLGGAFVLSGWAMDFSVAPEFSGDAGLQLLTLEWTVVAGVDLHPGKFVFVAFELSRLSGTFEFDD